MTAGENPTRAQADSYEKPQWRENTRQHARELLTSGEEYVRKVSLLVMGFSLLLSGIAVVVPRRKLANRPRLFANTVAELSRDQEQLRQP